MKSSVVDCVSSTEQTCSSVKSSVVVYLNVTDGLLQGKESSVVVCPSSTDGLLQGGGCGMKRRKAIVEKECKREQVGLGMSEYVRGGPWT